MKKSIGLLRLRSLHRCLWLLGALLLAGTPAEAAKIKAGDILVVDQNGGTNHEGALISVDPLSGERSSFSDFGNPAQGPTGYYVSSVTIRQSGRIYVSTLFTRSFGNGTLFEVDPKTGNRTLVADISHDDLQGTLAYGLAVDTSGEVFANLEGATPPFASSVIRVDPKTGNRVLISDLTNPAQGETGQYITDLALEDSGKKKILIGAYLFADGTTPHTAIFQVNRDTGERTLVSDFTNPAQGGDVVDLEFSVGLAETSGRILANSGDSVYAPRNLLLSIDPETGSRTVLSDFDNPTQGPPRTALEGLSIEKSGDIIVGAGETTSVNTTRIFRVNPRTGGRTELSDPNNPAQGTPFFGITYLAVVP